MCASSLDCRSRCLLTSHQGTFNAYSSNCCSNPVLLLFGQMTAELVSIDFRHAANLTGRSLSNSINRSKSLCNRSKTIDIRVSKSQDVGEVVSSSVSFTFAIVRFPRVHRLPDGPHKRHPADLPSIFEGDGHPYGVLNANRLTAPYKQCIVCDFHYLFPNLGLP